MNTINEIIGYIVPETIRMNHLHTSKELLVINYSAIFCQDDNEYEGLNKEALKIGIIIENTSTGPLYKLHKSIKTLAGHLSLLKIRKPDPTRPQRGDADFTLKDYYSFKKKHLKDARHFRVIDRGHFEMIELRDIKFNVLSYFSNIPLTVQLNIK